MTKSKSVSVNDTPKKLLAGPKSAFKLAHDKNGLPQLSELSLKVEKASDGNSIAVEVNLRFGMLECEDGTVEIKSCDLQLQLEGFRADAGTFFGEVIRKGRNLTRSVSKETHSSSEASVGADASIAAKVSGGGIPAITPKLSASAKGMSKTFESTKEKVKYNESTQEGAVRYIGGNSWRITADQQTNFVLSDKYLHNDVMCHAHKIDGANRAAIAAYVAIPEKNLKFSHASKSWFGRVRGESKMTQTEMKLLNILIAKSLHSQISGGTDMKYQGVLVPSWSELEHEE